MASRGGRWDRGRRGGIRNINRRLVRSRWFNLRICVWIGRKILEREREREKKESRDQGPGDSREDTRQASGFGVVACKTTERYLSVARFDPVGSDYPFIVSPRKNRVLARGKRYKYFNKHSCPVGTSSFRTKIIAPIGPVIRAGWDSRS